MNQTSPEAKPEPKPQPERERPLVRPIGDGTRSVIYDPLAGESLVIQKGKVIGRFTDR